MKISIVTPVYNGEKFIQETFQSILSQTGDFELEHIIVDGKSTDNTPSLIQQYVKEFEHQFGQTPLVISEKDSSMYEALTKGFSHATGDIQCYLNADDIFLNDTLSKVSSLMARNKEIQWLTGKPLSIHADGSQRYTKLPSYYLQRMIRQGFHGVELPFIQQESCFWRAQLWKGFDWERYASFKYSGDYFMWFHFCRHTDLYQLDINLCAARIHEGRLSSNVEGYRDEMKQIRSSRTPLSYLLMIWVYASTYLFPDTVKAVLNPKIIRS